MKRIQMAFLFAVSASASELDAQPPDDKVKSPSAEDGLAATDAHNSFI